jgi:hypothetical protein
MLVRYRDPRGLPLLFARSSLTSNGQTKAVPASTTPSNVVTTPLLRARCRIMVDGPRLALVRLSKLEALLCQSFSPSQGYFGAWQFCAGSFGIVWHSLGGQCI